MLKCGIQCVLLVELWMYAFATPIRNNLLHTWWHNNSEYNENSPVADDHVRASTIYHVQVSTKGVDEHVLYDSFAYMSIPRSGRDKWGYDNQDGAEFATQANLTMTWSSFQYLADVWVTVTLLKEHDHVESENDIIIRPTTLNFRKEIMTNKLFRVLVPHRFSGYRFSIELNQQLFTIYNFNNSPSENPNGKAVHTEPRAALLIFAESMLTTDYLDDYVPNPRKEKIHYVIPGQVDNLNSINDSVIYFRPGTYYMPWNYHANLSNHVQWVYLAPGAYVKGAFQYQSTDSVIRMTGFGVLSGEKYVYEADTNNSYHHTNATQCWATCVKMLRFTSKPGKQQHLHLHGVTITDPPYHSFVVYGEEDSFRLSVSSYHQVGSWYWQTDGLEIYRESRVINTFFHSNDDVLKIYHSDVRINNVVVWKNENGPVIQWGWAPRTINNVIVDTIDVIHNRIWWSDIKHNTCIINSATYYADTESTRTADPYQLISNITLSNIRSEGMSPCSIRIYALSSIQSFHVQNLWIDRWNELNIQSQVSLLKAYTDKNGRKVIIGNQSQDKNGISIENYTVDSVRITKMADNWRDIQLGRLGFDADLWNNWDAV